MVVASLANLIAKHRNLFYAGLATASSCLLFLYKSVKIFKLRQTYKHIPGPPTNGIFGFYFGNLDLIIKNTNDGKILADLVVEWVNKYGNVIKFQVFDKIVVFTIEPEAVRDLLIIDNHPKIQQIYENVGFPYNERYLGRGLITEVDNSRWKTKRDRLNSAFHRKPLNEYLNDFNMKCDILIERLRTLADGKTVVTVFNEVNHAALDIIANVGFGLEVDSINDPCNQLNRLVYESVKGFYRITFDPLIYYKPHEWSYIKSYKNVIRSLRDLARKQILNRLESIKDGSYFSKDILTYLLKKTDKADIEDMVDNFLTFFVAGQETTANTLAFAFFELAKNERVMKKIREEIENIMGSRTQITNEDLTKMNYTLCFYKEVLRLYPPIPEIGRALDYDMYINGYLIPKGTWVQISTYVSGRNDKFFDKPLEFYPERFLIDPETNETKIKNYTYFPFSLGPRHCLGQNFAQMVSKVFLAKIVKYFDFKLDLSQNMGLKQEATLRPADGARCIFSARSE